MFEIQNYYTVSGTHWGECGKVLYERVINYHNKLLIPRQSLKRFIIYHISFTFEMGFFPRFAACLSCWQFITAIHMEKWCLKGWS